MSSAPLRRLSPAEYLAFERRAETKNEYVGGEIFAMAGASGSHNLIVANVVTELNVQMRGRPCFVYPSDLKVAVSQDGPFYYPDVVALCDEPRFLDDEDDTLLNPAAVIEVLSPSTEAFDRGLKFAHYRTMASVQEVLFIAQDTVRVEHFVRRPDGQWLFSDRASLEAIFELTSIGCRLALDHVYDKVETGLPTPPVTH